MREELRRARDDLSTFATLAGYPLTGYQAEALRLEQRTTVIAAPRQTGKSYGLSLLSLWWGFRKSNQHVLLVSAGEEGSKRLLRTIADIAARNPLLQGSVLNETASLLLLSNGSEIRSVPASERQIRGWSVDLLIVDEATYVPEDVLLGAALPTTAARPNAKVVLASTPWAMEGAFYRFFLQGRDESVEHTRSYQWKLADAPWITEEVVEQYRATLPPLRFRAEFEGEFVGATDALFPLRDLMDAIASYRLLGPADARREEITVGVDWGRAFDRHAIVAVGVLEDYGVNDHPVLFLPYLHTSQVPYSEMVTLVASLNGGRKRSIYFDPFYSLPARPEVMASGWTLHETAATVLTPQQKERASRGFTVKAYVTEMNGVGAMPSEELARRLGRQRVVGVHSSQRSKEDAFSRLRALLSDRRLVLPDHIELIRQLQGLTVTPTRSGGLTIEASDPNVHDDLADALALAVSAVPHDTRGGVPNDQPSEVEWIETPGGIRLPASPRPRRPGSLARNGRVVTW